MTKKDDNVVVPFTKGMSDEERAKVLKEYVEQKAPEPLGVVPQETDDVGETKLDGGRVATGILLRLPGLKDPEITVSAVRWHGEIVCQSCYEPLDETALDVPLNTTGAFVRLHRACAGAPRRDSKACVKCGSLKVGVRFCEGCPKRPDEHLHRRCSKCGYGYLEGCKDAR